MRGAVYGRPFHEIERDEQRLFDARIAHKGGLSAAVAECPLRARSGLWESVLCALRAANVADVHCADF